MDFYFYSKSFFSAYVYEMPIFHVWRKDYYKDNE